MSGVWPVDIAYTECANGVYEFWLTIDGHRVSKSIWRDVGLGDPREHAAMALKQILVGKVHPPGSTVPIHPTT